jgi:hypothetical protein
MDRHPRALDMNPALHLRLREKMGTAHHAIVGCSSCWRRQLPYDVRSERIGYGRNTNMAKTRDDMTAFR